MHLNLQRALAGLLAPAVLAVAGCGGRVSAFGADSAQNLTIHAAETRLDTGATTRLTATLPSGEPVQVEWSLSGGDPAAGPGQIRPDGLYTPPSYLTRDAVTVTVSAALPGQPASVAALSDAELTVTPGFLQPLTPGNLTLGPNGSVTISGSMTEVGGSEGIHFELAADSAGAPADGGTLGTLSATHCVRNPIEGSSPAYTVCAVTYTAPAVLPASGSVFVLGSVASSPARSWTRIQLNSAGINSNPVAHQAHLAVPVELGSSSGNNSDYDSSLGQLSDCCGGTLGALVQDASGNQFVLSNNHVLARSDQSIPGETIIQPGLIDNGCTPYGVGPGTTPVATLTGYPALSSPATNVDAAIARVTPGAVDPKGSILELGARQPDGALASAPPGVSSSNGKGEAASLGMTVAKSGRTTGLTCAQISAISVDVTVDYFTDCAETDHSLAKTFTNQIAIAGVNFSDAGDSGALVVDTANAEPVGLFYAGGTDTNGVEQAIANPIGDVLAELDTQVPAGNGPASYSLVGGADHPVACLSYGGAKAQDDAASSLSAAERERAEAALPLAEPLVNSTTGIARVGVAASRDHPGEAAIALYAAPAALQSPVASSLGGVSTVVLPAGAQPAESTPVQPRAASLAQALAVKQRVAAGLLKSNPAIFGVGVGQSLDNPSDAAVILFVDRHKAQGALPDSLDGQRVRVILMDRLHVTRSHGSVLNGPVLNGSVLNGSAVHGSGACPTRREPPSSTPDDAIPEPFPLRIPLPD